MDKISSDKHVENIDAHDAANEKGRPDITDEDALHKADLGMQLDYSGASEKTDPAEIKLVRKLDLWIMPMQVLRAMSARSAKLTVL